MQKELTDLKEKTNAEQQEQTEANNKIREQLRRRFEEYMYHKDSDMTTRGELHLVRCLHSVLKEVGENLDGESKDVATTIRRGYV